MARQQVFPPRLLVAGGEVSVDEQIRGLAEGALLAHLFDGNPAVPEDSFLAVEEGDGTHGGGGVHEGRIERHQAGLRAQVGDVHALLALGTFQHLQIEVLLACRHADGL